MRIGLGAVVVAAVLALGAMPAMAAKFVFDVTVTGTEVVDFGPAYDVTRVETAVLPQTFQVTIFTTGPVSFETFLPGFGSAGNVDIISPVTPLSAELYALAGIPEGAAPSGYFGLLRGEAGFNYMKQAAFGTEYVAFTPGSYAYYGFAIYNEGVGNPGDSLIPYTLHTFDQALRDIDSFTFQEVASVETYKDPRFVSVTYASYVGTAVYRADLSVAPEPGTWALLIMGFGLTGAMLRTRRAAGLRA